MAGIHLAVEDVQHVAAAVLRHRIILNFDAHADGQTPETILSGIIKDVSAQALGQLVRMADAPLLDREFLEQLERLTIHWQKSFAGLVGGHNISRFAGAGQEFLDHRNFHHGDDLRAVNWRAYMRLEKLFLKMFQVEPRVPVRMLIDMSESMMAHGAEKFDYARRLRRRSVMSGWCGWTVSRSTAFRNRLTHRMFSHRRAARISAVMDAIAAMEAGGRTDYLAMVREFIGTYSQRGLVIIISDFLDDQGCDKRAAVPGGFRARTDAAAGLGGRRSRAAVGRRAGTARRRNRAAMKLDFDEEARERYTHAFDEYCRSCSGWRCAAAAGMRVCRLRSLWKAWCSAI